MTLATGTVLQNRYRVVKLIGQGGFGAVYRAWDLSLNCPCALKENFDASVEAAQQFAGEASMLANLRHRNLPRVTNHFVLPGQGQYLVMDFVEGEDLQTRLDHQGRLPENQAVDWIGQIADALTYLHSRIPPVIHRDVKPHNIILATDGTAMLVDFGIAKLYDPTTKTFVAARAVTEGYSPYEQYGNGRTDARSDVYALGATLYALLTGTVPVESIQRIGHDTLVPPRSINPNVSPFVERAILRAIQVFPDQRFQSALDFKNALAAPFIPAPATPSSYSSVASVAAPMPVTLPRTSLAVEYASWGRRAAAWLIDWVLLYFALFPCSFVGAILDAMTASAGSSSYSGSSGAFASLASCAWTLATPAYFVFLHALGGQTLGKKMLGIKVVRIDTGREPNLGWSVVRLVGTWVSTLILCLGYLWPLWDDRKQAIHDKMAGTVVIRV